MKLLDQDSYSPLVVCEFGTGFFDTRRRELRKAFGVHVSPQPREMREATATEARAFFAQRAGASADLSAYYDRATNTGD